MSSQVDPDPSPTPRPAHGLSDHLLELGIAEVVPYALPLTRRFRGTTLREGVLLRGPSGWGEWAPFPEYDDVTGARWLVAALEQAAGVWPAARRGQIAVNAIIPALAPADAAQFARQAYDESGCTTIKVKVAEVGTTSADDRDRVLAIVAALPGHVRIRIDANGGWSPSEAEDALQSLADLDLEYVEQPCATLAQCAELKQRIVRIGLPTKIAVDEGLRRASDPDDDRVHAQIRAAADIVIVKAAPLGGVAAALRIAAHLDLPTVVSGALDTSVGLSSGLALAAALPGQPYAAGLGTGRLLARDVVAVPIVPHDGRLDVLRHEPDAGALAAAAAALSIDRCDWWTERLARCLSVLRDADRNAFRPDAAGWSS